MSQAPSPLETTQGYHPPTVTQFSVFLVNKVGKMLDLVERFENTNLCKIYALSVHEASDHAVVRLVTSNANKAREILKHDGFPFSERDVLVVELSGKHTLGTMCLSILAAELSIQFAYPLMIRTIHGHPSMALAVDDLTLAGQLLRRKDFTLLGEADLSKPD
jgi:hypothetical protein